MELMRQSVVAENVVIVERAVAIEQAIYEKVGEQVDDKYRQS